MGSPYFGSFEIGFAGESAAAGVPLVAEAPFGAGDGGTGDFPCCEAVPDDSGGAVAPAPDGRQSTHYKPGIPTF
jgi:hypothetical protein